MIETSRLLVFLNIASLVGSRLQPEGIFVPDRNPGDRFLFFLFTMPDLYRNSTVGPEVWRWLADRYGAAHLSRGGVQLALSNSHVCGETNGWCRQECGQTEIIDWRFKDICGAFYCCIRNINE